MRRKTKLLRISLPGTGCDFKNMKKKDLKKRQIKKGKLKKAN